MCLSPQGLEIRQIRFRFDGQPINETDTPAQVSWKVKKREASGRRLYSRLELASQSATLELHLIKTQSSQLVYFQKEKTKLVAPSWLLASVNRV